MGHDDSLSGRRGNRRSCGAARRVTWLLDLNLWPAIAACLGLAVSVYAAMGTEIDDLKRRAAFGIAGVTVMSVGILLI